MPKVALFFTWDVSLEVWQEKGLLQREVKFYEELAHKGVGVTFLTWGGVQDIEIGKSLRGIETVPIYTCMKRPSNKMLRAIVSLYAPWAVRREIKGADIVKTNQMWGGWCPVLAKVIFRKPLLVRTGFELYQFTRKQHGYARQVFIWFLSAVVYRAANLIHLATDDDRAFVKKHFKVPDSKIKIMPNWIDTELFCPQQVEEKENHILFVGRLTAQKNLEELIKAVSGTEWTLDIVGDGELKGALEALAQRSGAKVNFLGYCPNDRLPALYNRYPVYILPSLYEGNPKTLLEAMACGRAVIGADVGGISSVIEDGVTGLLCGTHAQSQREAIDKLMKDKMLRQRLGAAARRQIEEKQTIERLVNDELASYRFLQEAGS